MFILILILVAIFIIGGAMVLLKTAKPPKIDNPDKLNRNWDDDDEDNSW